MLAAKAGTVLWILVQYGAAYGALYGKPVGSPGLRDVMWGQRVVQCSDLTPTHHSLFCIAVHSLCYVQ